MQQTKIHAGTDDKTEITKLVVALNSDYFFSKVNSS